MINMETEIRRQTIMQRVSETEVLQQYGERLLTVRTVRNLLGVSAPVVANLIRDGKLEAFDIFEEMDTVDETNVGRNGIRITQDSVQRFLDSARIR